MSKPLPTVDPMSTSHNGWPVVRAESTWALPAVTGRALAGPVWVVLNWLAKQYAAHVEPIDQKQSWGYAYRYVRGSSTTWSNHASGTAVDFNANQHPMSHRGTMTPTQAQSCRDIETEAGGVLNWGDNIPDEMHWEIAKGVSRDRVESLATRILQQRLGVTIDGVRGPATLDALRTFQAENGLTVDGIDGPATWAALDNTQPAAPPATDTAQPTPQAPTFPLPDGSYFGPKSGPARSVSGYYSHEEDLRAWQQRMKDRGWRLDADGRYGPDTKRVATAFQQQKGLTVDGLIGPDTWAAAWTTPITND